jgi:beta-lactamase superfamily II metal-dependent hydrolase
MPRTADGKLTIACLKMGHGDCTLIKCPSGSLFMVDCGSAELERPNPLDRKVKYLPTEVLLDDAFLGKDKMLDALIFTHHDQDHYNKVAWLFTNGVRTRKIYHSGLMEHYSKGSRVPPYGDGVSSEYFRLLCVKPKKKEDDPNEEAITDYQNIRGVTLNKKYKLYSTRNPKNEKETVFTSINVGTGVDEYSTTRGVKVHECTKCKISILCAGVTTVVDPEEESVESRSAKRSKSETTLSYEREIVGASLINMSSIITLIEFNGGQYLICGDAVKETEKFVLDNYTDVKNLEILRAPHHGSNTFESSHLTFIQTMNPRIAVFSASSDSHSQNLPRCETLTSYATNCSRLIKNVDDSDADTSIYACFYSSNMVVEGLRNGKSAPTIWYDPKQSAKANIRLTGWHKTIYARPKSPGVKE